MVTSPSHASPSHASVSVAAIAVTVNIHMSGSASNMPPSPSVHVHIPGVTHTSNVPPSPKDDSPTERNRKLAAARAQDEMKKFQDEVRMKKEEDSPHRTAAWDRLVSMEKIGKLKVNDKLLILSVDAHQSEMTFKNFNYEDVQPRIQLTFTAGTQTAEMSYTKHKL